MSDVIGLEVSALQLHGSGRLEVAPAERGGAQRDIRPRLHGGIRALQYDVATMGELVETALGRALTAVADRDVELAGAVRRGDAAVNALQQRVREGCFRTLVTEAPLCRDLRAVMAAVQMSSEFERMGDHCVSIARQALALADLPPTPASAGLRTLGALCARQVHAIVHAIVSEDADAARAVAARDDDVDAQYHEFVDGVIREIPHGTRDAFRTTTHLLIAHHLERVGDRVTNIAEELVFAVTGEQERLG